MDIFLKQKARASAADMALIKEYAINDSLNCLIKWGIFKDDICTFSTKFKSDWGIANGKRSSN